jgi:flagellar hook-length control protein FliK
MLPVGIQGVANLLVSQAAKVPAATPGKGSSASDSTPGRGNDAARRNADSRPAPRDVTRQTSANAQVPADVPAQAKSVVASDKSSKKGGRGDKTPAAKSDATRNAREAGGAPTQAADVALSFAAVFAQVGRAQATGETKSLKSARAEGSAAAGAKPVTATPVTPTPATRPNLVVPVAATTVPAPQAAAMAPAGGARNAATRPVPQQTANARSSPTAAPQGAEASGLQTAATAGAETVKAAVPQKPVTVQQPVAAPLVALNGQGADPAGAEAGGAKPTVPTSAAMITATRLTVVAPMVVAAASLPRGATTAPVREMQTAATSQVSQRPAKAKNSPAATPQGTEASALQTAAVASTQAAKATSLPKPAPVVNPATATQDVHQPAGAEAAQTGQGTGLTASGGKSAGHRTGQAAEARGAKTRSANVPQTGAHPQVASADVAAGQSFTITGGQAHASMAAAGTAAKAAPVGDASPDAGQATSAEAGRQAVETPVADQIVQSIRGSSLRVDRQLVVRLSPPELGKVRITLRTSGNQIHGVLEAENPETFKRLERETVGLVSRLQDAGLQVQRLDVTLTHQDGGPMSENPMARDGRHDQSQGGAEPHTVRTTPEEHLAAVEPASQAEAIPPGSHVINVRV